MRCHNPKNAEYKWYGARGIKVCDEWRFNRKAFFEWALKNGYNETLSIERVDVNGDYCPENCKWIPLSEQPLNTRNTKYITYNGETLPMAEMARKMGLKPDIVQERLKYLGWTVERALTTPPMKFKKRNIAHEPLVEG